VSWSEKVERLADLLRELQATSRDGAAVDHATAFERWVGWTLKVRDEGRTIYFVGNGASASMASHFSADMAKNGKVHTQVFTDPALVTALGNDLGYENVFAEPLRRRGREGDMLVAISSSGRSPNILAAAEVARAQGLTLVTLTGMDADNPLRASGDLNLYVPAATYGNAETSHAVVLHHWMDAVA
jgi:D-sedoheptulose 7-phosphate isomerase